MSKKIMIVDDEEDIRISVGQIFEVSGYEIIKAENGNDCLTKLENSEVIKRLLYSIIDVISRRSSEDYALVMLGNTINKLQEKYNSLLNINITTTRYTEIDNLVNVDSAIDNVDSNELGKAVQDIIRTIVVDLGENAGFFFIKEIKNKIGPNYEMIIRNMGVDFDFMQFNFEFDKKQSNALTIEHSDLFRRVLKTLIDIIDKKINKAYAISTIKTIIENISNKYDFLKNITINDVRYTLGENESRGIRYESGVLHLIYLKQNLQII